METKVRKLLNNPGIYHLGTDNSIMYLNHELAYKEPKKLELQDLYLLKVSSVSFDEQAPKKEALENVLSSVRMEGINFIFLIMGEKEEVNFYYGIARDLSAVEKTDFLIMDIGDEILKPAMSANYRGSTISRIESGEKEKILKRLQELPFGGMIEGVPGANKDDEKYQGIDRLVNVMYGDSYCFMVVAKPLGEDAVTRIQDELYRFYDNLNPVGKVNVQSGTGQNSGTSTGTTTGSSKTAGTSNSTTETEGSNSGYSLTEGSGRSKSFTRGTSKGNSSSEGGGSSSGTSNWNSGSNTGTSESGTEGTNTSKSETTTGGRNYSKGETRGDNFSKTINDSTSDTTNKGSSSNQSYTLEFVNRRYQDFIKFMDDVVFPRLDYGKGKGMFLTSMYVSAENKSSLQKIKNTITALYSGEAGNKVPLKAMNLHPRARRSFTTFQLPGGTLKQPLSENELSERFAMHQMVEDWENTRLGNWITTNELGMIAGLPQKEVVGLSLNEEVEFGLNFASEPSADDRIELGTLIQNGNELENTPVYLDKKELDKHIFVTGVTGSGKTTTCQKILKEANVPFLVIEPAKTEYRVMKADNPDLLIFTLGDTMTNPLRMNPFMFYPKESITSRADMLCASIQSAFDMEAAIPQIIERAIYRSYEDYGWNIDTNQNFLFDDPWDGTGEAFPTMEDLVKNCKIIVDEQGFDVRLKSDYIGSINARLLGLTSGSKGFLLNTHVSVDFMELLDHQVVFELENIRNGAEKSLLMGFILINLSEAIREKYQLCGKFTHITLVEEAHRLLSKYTPGDNPNKKHGVEMFADMLAEIRKYGECLVIADQIPDKLTPDVLKNTNTKIIHRIFAADDKDAVGNTVMLKKEQKEFLSNLQTGRAIYFTSATEKAVQIHIKRSSDTSIQTPDNEEIKDAVREYYCENYQRGLFPGLEFFQEVPTMVHMNCLYEMFSTSFAERYLSAISRQRLSEELKGSLAKYESVLGGGILLSYLWKYGLKVSRYDLPDTALSMEAILCLYQMTAKKFAVKYIHELREGNLKKVKEFYEKISTIDNTEEKAQKAEESQDKIKVALKLDEEYQKAKNYFEQRFLTDYIWDYAVAAIPLLLIDEDDGKDKLNGILQAGEVQRDQRNWLKEKI